MMVEKNYILKQCFEVLENGCGYWRHAKFWVNKGVEYEVFRRFYQKHGYHFVETNKKYELYNIRREEVRKKFPEVYSRN